MKVKKTDAEWKAVLPSDVYHVTREKGTEAPFSGKYDKFYGNGKYMCSNCKHYLFNSNTKFNSGSGWPSFYDIAVQDNITTHLEEDNFFLPNRTEVLCGCCGAHLGHVFNDGPQPTGLRYCINSLALDFQHDDGDS